MSCPSWKELARDESRETAEWSEALEHFDSHCPDCRRAALAAVYPTELRRGENGWVAIDLGSTNGMKINGRRVSQAQLDPGDRITVGVTDLTFELD